ncbi:Sec-independent protein translocase protein TatB [Salinisphaera sp. SPP-AMP-43]|uniref:Sec-independent protein translocase protein TatB n=1 Tax=Salinisphaera sp. SPP-AMP-43 TaxID=3121288 RepID=UPI003C6DFADF
MFDIGFWELATLGVIGLIVLGPERLPVVARTLGRWVGRARHYVSALTSELENEVGAEDIRNDVRRARERIESETQDIRSRGARMADTLNEPAEGRDASSANVTAEQSEADHRGATSETADTRAERRAADDESRP